MWIFDQKILEVGNCFLGAQRYASDEDEDMMNWNTNEVFSKKSENTERAIRTMLKR